jgi:CubicO group peptidase (beta-lactamase class C family)
MKKILLLSILWVNTHSLIAQTVYSKEIEEQIKQVENNLGGRVIINGKPFNIFDRMAEYKVKGVSIAVIQNYKLLWAKGYGVADEKEKLPVTEKTLFNIASTSKSINSMGVLKLAQDKKLDLTADINKYLTSWKFPYDSVSKGKKITTLNLLSHTGGLSNNSPSYYFNETIPTLIQELNGTPPSKASPVRSVMEPDIEAEYSNPGVGITQLLVNDITKLPYDKYIYETIFKPLGMNDSYYTQESLNIHKQILATGYKEGVEVPGKRVFEPNLSAGGVWTTPTDFCKFICELQLSYSGKSNKVLSQKMATKMLTPYMNKTALGAFISEIGGTKYFGHGGDVPGFTSDYYATLEGGNGVVVFVNAYHAREFIYEIFNSVATVYKWKGFYKPIMKNEIAVPDNTLTKYTGTYLFDGLLVTILKKDKNYYYVSKGTYSKLHFTTEKNFYNTEFSSEKTLLTDASGNVTGFLRYQNSDTLTTAIKVTNIDTLNTADGEMVWAGWHYLENRQYDEAIKYLKRGLTVRPDDQLALENLAHCYLFKNEYEEAIKLYKKYLSKNTGSDLAQDKEMIKQDFVLFKNNGFDKSLMDKVFAELKIEIPIEYSN